MTSHRPARRQVVIGVDGGATTTEIVVAGLDGGWIAQHQVGCTNHEVVGLEAATAELGGGIATALERADADAADVAASAFGLAGVDWASDEPRLGAAVSAFGLGGRRLVVNDALVALRAGSRRPWGIVSCVGTATVTAGVGRDGRRARTMAVGWGEPSGASSLVRDALHAIAAAHHRTAPTTALAGAFLAATALADVEALFEAITRGGLRVGPSFAPLVREVCDAGDVVARQLLERSGRDHAAMVVGVADRLDLRGADVEVVTSGGVHASGGPFAAAFADHLREHCPQASLAPLQRPPVAGAVTLALELLDPIDTGC
ncbi:MAG: BadF/BadG/BcrA/BcrD ATPase family protein [Ilumatobacteraceae bacterium]|nr:hypothetical protein [Acidimicrobiales bacterium]